MKKHIALLVALALGSAAFASAPVDPAKPMVTGRGNVAVRPAKVQVTNQTAPKPEEPVRLEKFTVTGSLLPHRVQQPRHR